MPTSKTAPVLEEPAGEDQPQPLNLSVQVLSPSTCQRHVTVSVSPEDIERYTAKSLSDLVNTAAVPGFRQGRAPRKLVESRFKKEVADQVKGGLMVDAIAQVTESNKLAAISEPQFDASAVKLPDSGPLVFEFDIEVRPEFNLPEWRGLKLEKPVYKFTETDVDKRLERALANWGKLIPVDGPAQAADYVSCNLSFHADDKEISSSKEEVIRLRPTLSFRDGNIEKFEKGMLGVKAGETRELDASISDNAPNVDLRNKTIKAKIEVLEVKRLELPQLTNQFLTEIGFVSEEELRTEIRQSLEKQFEYQQRQSLRRQLTKVLLADANWDLPPDMLSRQSRRELERAILELQRSGYSEGDIRAHANQLRQNSQVSTARMLKEHFILERIAEDEKVDAESADFDDEIRLIAEQSEESPRRVRARIEKGNMQDALRNQIVERKVIDLVLQHASFTETAYKPEGTSDVEALDQNVTGEEADEAIPEASHPNEPEAPTTGTERGKVT
jgi:trigger factor